MDRNLALEVVRVTEAAAIASARLMGRGDRHGSDQAATDAMRRAFDSVHVRGTIVIGEGERDEAPMLYIGEKVGCGTDHDPAVDIAVDPLEGTNLCATGSPDAIAVIAMGDHGKLLNAPDTYMEKIAVGPTGRGCIDIRRSPAENLEALAGAKHCRIDELTAIVLDRPRHEQLIADIRRAGARIRLISDGDVAGAIATCVERAGIDILFGTGGAPEGVLAAAALRCVGGDMQGVLRPRNDEERTRAAKMGVADLDHVFALEELAQGEVMFAATGVTPGSFLQGVRFFAGGCTTHSVVMRSATGTLRFIEAEHHFDRKPPKMMGA
ncbi:MAG TPA: class II fructose-bisphosphatase [Myxococcota bacterium]|jgi:fructose-1,6-bisphosphatase II|nr:class II fructose-bisphosphatase [Myxococcota bacterium]